MWEKQKKQKLLVCGGTSNAVTYLECLMIKVFINFGILAGFQFLKFLFLFCSKTQCSIILFFHLENPPVIVYRWWSKVKDDDDSISLIRFLYVQILARSFGIDTVASLQVLYFSIWSRYTWYIYLVYYTI